jgi:hypothetical protein
LATGKLTFGNLGIAADDWQVLQTARPNVLVIGPNAAVTGFIELLLPYLQTPVAEDHDGQFTAPPHPGGTLILHDVSRLDADNQERLSGWLAEPNRRTQVISTSSCSLYSFVEREVLSASLYYSLNVIMITLSEPSPDSGH